jgi:hypothetical protein
MVVLQDRGFAVEGDGRVIGRDQVGVHDARMVNIVGEGSHEKGADKDGVGGDGFGGGRLSSMDRAQQRGSREEHCEQQKNAPWAADRYSRPRGAARGEQSHKGGAGRHDARTRHDGVCVGDQRGMVWRGPRRGGARNRRARTVDRMAEAVEGSVLVVVGCDLAHEAPQPLLVEHLGLAVAAEDVKRKGWKVCVGSSEDVKVPLADSFEGCSIWRSVDWPRLLQHPTLAASQPILQLF